MIPEQIAEEANKISKEVNGYILNPVELETIMKAARTVLQNLKWPKPKKELCSHVAWFNEQIGKKPSEPDVEELIAIIAAHPFRLGGYDAWANDLVKDILEWVHRLR